MHTASSSPQPLMARDWLGHRWTAWMPLMAAHPLALAQLPEHAGLYRVRRAGEADRLEWVGWAARGVRAVVERLSRQVHLPIEPYDEPGSPARQLWLLRCQEGLAFEVSGVELALDDEAGRGRAGALCRVYGARTGGITSR
jgi:hypothetical protein